MKRLLIHYYDHDCQEITEDLGDDIPAFAQAGYFLRKRGVDFTAWEITLDNKNQFVMREVVP